jgi:K+-sensing histidine kinase KdpD
MNAAADPRRAHTTGIVVGLAGVVVVTWLIHLSRGQVEVLSMAVLYQLLVLAVSGIYGAVAGLTTGLVSAVAFNWCVRGPSPRGFSTPSPRSPSTSSCWRKLAAGGATGWPSRSLRSWSGRT